MGTCSFCAKKIPISQRIKYNQPKTNQSSPKPGETLIYRNEDFVDKPLLEPTKTMQELFLESFGKFEERSFLGERKLDANGVHEQKYTWQSYREVMNIVMKLGSG